MCRSDRLGTVAGPVSETSDAAVTIDLNNLVGLDIREGMNALTDFGDAAVLLPLSIVILLWMLIHHGRTVSVSWVIAVSLCVGATTLLKIYFYACPPQPNLVSPSGHTSLSVLIYGAIALVIAAEQRGWSRAMILFSHRLDRGHCRVSAMAQCAHCARSRYRYRHWHRDTDPIC